MCGQLGNALDQSRVALGVALAALTLARGRPLTLPSAPELSDRLLTPLARVLMRYRNWTLSENGGIQFRQKSLKRVGDSSV